MSKFEQLRAELERIKQKTAQGDATKRAEKAEDDIIFWQTSERSLLAAVEELSIEEYLNGIRDEIWQLGEVTVTPPQRREDIVWRELWTKFELHAGWPIFVPAGGQSITSEVYDSWGDHVGGTGVGLEILVKASRDDVTVFIDGKRKWKLKYQGAEDVQKLEKILIDDCMNRASETPYNQRKKECEEEIVKRGLKSELTEYRLSR